MRFVIIKRRIIGALILICIFITMHLGIITFIGLVDNIVQCDYGIVLGSGLRNGEITVRCTSRLDKALELHGNGIFRKFIVSGIVDKNGNSEARLMQHYLLDHSVLSNQIIVDERGSTTYATVLRCKELIPDVKKVRILIVSQFYHITRSLMAFRSAGFTNVYHSHSTYHDIKDVFSLFREIIAIYCYFFANKL